MKPLHDRAVVAIEPCRGAYPEKPGRIFMQTSDLFCAKPVLPPDVLKQRLRAQVPAEQTEDYKGYKTDRLFEEEHHC